MVLEDKFSEIEDICLFNSNKVLEAFWHNNVSEACFNGTTGYGYGDLGRDTLEKVYAEVFKAEDALVRNQFISGTHAISTALFALLRPGDTLLSISGKPYDTLDSVIGLNDNASSLKAFGIKYEQIDLVNDDFDDELIKKRIRKGGIKVVAIQRSMGYAIRASIDYRKLSRIIKVIKEIDEKVIVFVDNCYCEFVTKVEPIELGADICIGSLIKNLGAGIAENGAYIVGRKDLIHLCSERLNVAGEGKEVGPTLGVNKGLFLSLYMAPSVVKNALKTAVFAAYELEKMGFKVSPRWNEERVDIVERIEFNDKDLLILFVECIQKYSAIDHNVVPIPSAMPGYEDNIIMASGSFVQGSSIELSCDGPLREPYVAFLQGSLTFEYGKIAITKAIEVLAKKDKN